MCTKDDITTGSPAGPLSNDDHVDSPQPPCSSRPFDPLPTEIIRQIFVLTCPFVTLPGEQHVMRSGHGDDPPLADPLILSMVCRRWQDITIEYHSLWATLAIRCNSMEKGAWDKWGFSKLRNYLTRSGDHALDIRIYDGKEIPGKVVWGSLALVIEHSKRWKNVVLDFPLGQRFINELDSLEGRLPILESLYFCASDSSQPTPPTLSITGGKFLHSPSVKRIIFGSASFIPTTILQHTPWHHVYTVVFGRTKFRDEREFRQILEYLSISTKELTFVGVSIDPWATSLFGTQAQGPVALDKLHKLHIVGFHELMDAFVCPSLKHLEIGPDLGGDEDELVHFLKNSSCALTHIDILSHAQHGLGHPRKYYMIFQSPSLSTLRSISLKEFADSILDLLNFDSHRLFPLLETVYLEVIWKTATVGIRHITSCIQGLRQIVQSRTQPESPKHDESSAKTRQAAPLSSLKICHFNFKLDTDRSREDDDVNLTERMLEELRLFCISRKIKIQQEFVFFPTPILVWDSNEDDASDGNGGDYASDDSE